MKKTPLIIGIVAIFAIVGLVALSRIGNQSTQVVKNEEVLSAHVTALSSDVYRVNESEELIDGESEANEGDTIRTSDSGRAIIEYDHVITLDADSEVVLARLDAGHTTGRLSAGRVWSRVEKVFDQGEFYEIETTTTRAAVRGTSFGVSYIGGVTTIIVAEGSVEGEVFATRETFSVSAGEKARIVNGSVAVSAIVLSDHDEWFVFNNPGAKLYGGGEMEELPVNNSPVEEPVVIDPRIDSFAPRRITEGDTQVSIHVRGQGMNQVTAAFFNDIQIGPVSIIDDSYLQIFVEGRLPAGIYELRLETISGEGYFSDTDLTVSEGEQEEVEPDNNNTEPQ